MALSFVPNKDEKSSWKNNESDSAWRNNNKICIITDEPITDAPDLDKYSQTLSNIIANSVPRFTVGIYGGWGTGKTTIMQMIQNHLDEKYKDDIITIWFDAWRYENEEFSALVPLVRTIILHLEDYVEKLEIEKSPNKAAIKNLADKFKKVGLVILQNSKVNAEASYSIAKASFETDIGDAMDHYKSEGSFFKNQDRVYFYKHISDHVKDELEKIRNKIDTCNFRIVIFIDDLDRCTPQRALEILESIKTMELMGEKMAARTLLDFENAILDLFEDNRIPVQDAKIVLWTILTAIYEDELIEEPERLEIIINNIERQKELLLINILGQK
jgi:predicted KAP-like P-loop ATPase